MQNINKSAEQFLELIKKARKGKLKIYIGMVAGVGKTYRMLEEAHSMLKNYIEVKIGFIEPHDREETKALVEGIPQIPLKKIFYKGKQLVEMDLQAIISQRPEVVVVDELAHTNMPGSKNKKRWQDVIDIIDAGINVITAVNIQHIESLNNEIEEITGIVVQERIPDQLIAQADEVVNIDLTADELINRLKEGKIYKKEKIESALKHFFKSEHILQLRQLALKEVASAVVRKVETDITRSNRRYKNERFLCCISTNEQTTKHILRKTARLANYYNSEWYVLYVQTKAESANRIALDQQRYLINNLKLAVELGAQIIKKEHISVAEAIIEECKNLSITTVCMGKPSLSLRHIFFGNSFFRKLLNFLYNNKIDLIILS